MWLLEQEWDSICRVVLAHCSTFEKFLKKQRFALQDGNLSTHAKEGKAESQGHIGKPIFIAEVCAIVKKGSYPVSINRRMDGQKVVCTCTEMVFSLQRTGSRVLAHAYDPRTLEAGAAEAKVQGQCGLHTKLEVSWGYTKTSYLKKLTRDREREDILDKP